VHYNRTWKITTTDKCEVRKYERLSVFIRRELPFRFVSRHSKDLSFHGIQEYGYTGRRMAPSRLKRICRISRGILRDQREWINNGTHPYTCFWLGYTIHITLQLRSSTRAFGKASACEKILLSSLSLSLPRRDPSISIAVAILREIQPIQWERGRERLHD